MSTLFGPNERPDANPPHENVIRRFREELRLGRPEFADLLDVKIDTLRVWETGKSNPRGPVALRIVETANRNNYPLTVEDIYPKKTKKK